MQSFHSMSMACLLWPFIYLLLASSTWAGPHSTGSLIPSESLTRPLQIAVPACARTCLESFVAENFPTPTCGHSPNLSCLCTSDSTSGFTVGEGALQCLAANCNNVNQSAALTAYGVCLSIPNFIANTHGTLTATIPPNLPTPVSKPQTKTSSNDFSSTPTLRSHSWQHSSTQASSPASSVSLSITSSSTILLDSSTPPTDSPQPTVVPGGGGSLPTASGTLSVATTSASAPSASSSAPVLTKPQIAGVAVAGVGAAAIACGFGFLIFCLRRRRSNKRYTSSSFGGDKLVDSEITTPDMSTIAARDFGSDHQPRFQREPRTQRSPTRQLRLETPATSSEDGWGQYHQDMAPEAIGLATGPPAQRSVRDEHSPITPASNRTRNSQLLPEMPTYSLFPSPLRGIPRNSIPNQNLKPPGNAARVPPVPPLGSPFARKVPHHPGSTDTSQTHLQGGKGAYERGSDPFIDNPRSHPKPYLQGSQLRPPPRSARRNTPMFRIPSWEQPPGVVRKPVPAYNPPRYQGVNPMAAPTNEHNMTTTENAHRRKPSRRKRNTPRPLTHFSSGSETSFETLDDEDLDAPDPRSALSPVKEVRSPPAGHVSYPAIPVSASESPTRRPKPVQSAKSDSLLSKRLGQEKAKEIAGRLKGSPQKAMDNSPQSSAKWKILVSPGLKDVENSGSPAAAKSVKSLPPNSTPWRR